MAVQLAQPQGGQAPGPWAASIRTAYREFPPGSEKSVEVVVQADRVAEYLAPDLRQLIGECVVGAGSGLRFRRRRDRRPVQRNLFRASMVVETSGRGHVLKLPPPLTTATVEWKDVADTLVEVASDTVNGSRILPAG